MTSRRMCKSLASPLRSAISIWAENDRPPPGWEENMRDELDEFFLDPTASESAKDGYLVLRANIHVTMAMTRLRLM
jgi:hypothetical protein